ncbi:hypothetical protein HK096_000502, partial [Nowakowskiella sp. JEL0078]
NRHGRVFLLQSQVVGLDELPTAGLEEAADRQKVPGALAGRARRDMQTQLLDVL